MKKVISFSVFGDNPKYTRGLIRNLELRDTIYPGWEIYVYYNNTVPMNIIEECKKFPNVTLFDMSSYKMPGMFWRFLPYKDVERFISRDTDSRLLMREKDAVDEWIESKKTLHIMRDHPHHGHPIFGGMFGLVIRPDFIMELEMSRWLTFYFDRDNLFNTWGDVQFLTDIVFRRFVGDMISHDSCFTHFPNSKPFPKPLDFDFRFVGEAHFGDDTRDHQWAEWKNRTELR